MTWCAPVLSRRFKDGVASSRTVAGHNFHLFKRSAGRLALSVSKSEQKTVAFGLTTHCFQVHNNTLMMIAQVGSEEQVARWIEPTIKRGALLPGCGAEPQGVPPSRQHGSRAGFW